MARTAPNRARPATILDVARAADVSKSTVSLVLQDSPLIRDATAEKVRAAAARLGYVYNRRAAELRRQSSNTIAVVINDLTNPFFTEVLVGIERKLLEAGYITLMAHTGEDLDLQARVLRSMREHHAAGIMLCPVFGTSPQLLKEVHAWGIPLLVLVRALGKGSYDYAGSRNERGMRLATEHLLGLGHRRVGFLGGQTGAVFDDRLRGYRRALKAHGVAYDEALVRRAKPDREGGYQAMRELLAAHPATPAAVCYNDIVAFGALAALGELGIAAGRDFAIVGFDGVRDAAHSNPPLSTVDIRPGELGVAAAGLMLERLQRPKSASLRYVAEPTLLLRQSG
ncbi:MAG TPA: LacI family DNA-binding transcriptional regulator [Burkholderiaceae bacterium]|nr:LacI family DNA-binding transcriptional regulator [Burkholderiaceae bacterium]